MNSQKDKIIVEACQLCGSTRLPVDIYLAGKNYEAKLSHLRKSKKFEMKVTYENNKIIVRDQKSKTVTTVSLVKNKTPEKKESKKSENL